MLLHSTAALRIANHNYWFTGFRKSAEIGTPYADVAWNYCDLKCLYLEQLKPNTDFFVINFQDVVYKPDFSVCYGKAEGGTTKIWY